MQGYIQYMCFYAPQKEKIGELFKMHHIINVNSMWILTLLKHPKPVGRAALMDPPRLIAAGCAEPPLPGGEDWGRLCSGCGLTAESSLFNADCKLFNAGNTPPTFPALNGEVAVCG